VTAGRHVVHAQQVVDVLALIRVIDAVEQALDAGSDEARVECDSYRNRWSAVKLFHLSATEDSRIMRGMKVAHLESPPEYLKDC